MTVNLTTRLFVVALSCTPPVAGRAAPVTYSIDAQRSDVVVQVFKAPSLAQALSHDHVIRASDVTGEISYDVDAPQTAAVHVTIGTATLVADEPALRRRFGLETEVSDKDRMIIERDMKGDDGLDVERFPAVTFTSVALKSGPGGTLSLDGKISIHGVSRRVTAPVTVDVKDGVLTGDAKVKLNQTDHGITPCSKFLGAVKCADEIVLNLHLVAVPRAAPTSRTKS